MRAPAVAVAVGFISGIVLATEGAGAFARVVAGIVLADLVRRAWTRARLGALVVTLAGLAGLATMLDAEAAARRRVQDWLVVETAIRVHLRGIVLDAPERGRDGSRRLTLRAQPEGRSTDPLRVELRIEPGPRSPMAQVDALRHGDEVRVFCTLRLPGRPGHPDREPARRALLARGLDCRGTVKSARLVEIVGRGRPSGARSLTILKAGARARLDRVLDPGTTARSVTAAMLLGDRMGLGPEEERLLRDSGLVHLLSISGLHVALIAVLFVQLLRRARLGAAWVVVVGTAAMAALAFAVGSEPPVLRAAAAASLVLFGRAIGREGDGLTTLAVVAAGMCALRPHVLWDLSFELSFAATAGILVFGRPIAATLPGPRLVSVPVGVSAAAYLAASPLVAFRFGRAAPISVVSNVLASLLCALTMGAGAAAIAFAGIPPAEQAARVLATASVDCLLACAAAAASVPGAAFRVATPSAMLLLVYFGLLVEAAEPGTIVRVPPATARILRLALALAVTLLHVGPPPPGPTRTTRLAVLDVGQGQAVVLRGPAGGFLVVDAGGSSGGRFDAGERVVAPFLAVQGCRRIDVLAITHAHDDHAGGAAALLREFDVGELWLGLGFHREPRGQALAAQAVASGVAVVLLERGFERERAGVSLEVLHPSRKDLDLGDNDRSAVLRARTVLGSVLVAGDLGAPGEARLLARGAGPRADVLVVGHHGSATGTTAALVESLAPRIAIVSVGWRNRYGHPHPTVIARLESAGARVFRTDQDGRVDVSWEPGRFPVRRVRKSAGEWE